jgi:CRP/FNR family transcriptional activator FtrB
MEPLLMDLDLDQCRPSDKGHDGSTISGTVMALTEAEAVQVPSIHLFKSLSDPSLSILLKSASVKHFPARIVLFSEGDRASTLYTLLQGSVELFSEHHDRRSTIAVIRSIRPFVLASITHSIMSMSARTLAHSNLLLVPLPVIHRLMDTDPAFARAVAYELAGDLHDIIHDFKSHRLRTSVERLAEWMVRSYEAAGSNGSFVIPHDKCTLASYLGMEPESLSRNLAALGNAGVSVRGREIRVNDPAALAEIARLSPGIPQIGACSEATSRQ